MSAFFAYSSYMPCTECGISVPAMKREHHNCDPERILDFRMFQLRDEVAAFEDRAAAIWRQLRVASRSGSPSATGDVARQRKR